MFTLCNSNVYVNILHSKVKLIHAPVSSSCFGHSLYTLQYKSNITIYIVITMVGANGMVTDQY